MNKYNVPIRSQGASLDSEKIYKRLEMTLRRVIGVNPFLNERKPFRAG
jgi:hypothetical protein